ncbi:hypothetical protein N7530_003932 [Penicillium desertorum]|uniref:PI-PLC Y-box domain-containing protein n=1 Tax=Penicillium desertorum TaxID=1303715 RepID=A0A9W9WX88_9EURO|nr:hypothetical protein N7530_003932 [Penicillium desertorum]
MFDLQLPIASPDLSPHCQGTWLTWSQLLYGTESSIVMAEQKNRDVVDQTLSGGEPSPSDVPASTNDNPSAGGDAGKTEHIAMTTATSNNSNLNDQQNHEKTNTPDSRGEKAAGDKDAGGSTTVSIASGCAPKHLLIWAQDTSKQGAGVVATRVLELNGLAPASDGGEDTASQGGSESDASRPDSRNQTHGGSVKKPSGFKPVSFAKFTVNKVPGAPTPPKAPEKAPTSTTPLGTPQPSSRPRLVAKSTHGSRDSFSKAGAGGGKPGGSGPDPNQVWNKNRPVAPAPPKHLTDEELKQQYGIHMTSRIQEDGAVSSEAKWADIDDDEDDWAPETIEWTDGTKVNLTQPHTEPPPAPSHREPKESPPVEPSVPKEPVKAAPKPAASMGSRAMVLKVGANAERQARTGSASSNGINDKVPSSSTSPAPPSKSPWAALPPVDRVSPVNAPVQPHQQRMPARYPQRDDGHHAPMAMPPKEIAADDFNRAWKDQSDLPQLFNPRSSQYEPVGETRRGSWRHDQHSRAPAVLQRPNDHPSGPAEPSAAFQTHRSSHQDGMGWGRRRTSSNVSGGSGGFGRRMSVGRFDAPPRFNDARRGSQVNGLGDSAIVGHEQHHGKDQIAPSGPNGTARPAVDVGMSPVETQAAVPQVPQEPQEDPVALQERIMKEKRLEARQRRIEQEEKEEAAKKERIRQRLAAMGPAPEKKAPETRKPPLSSTSTSTSLSLSSSSPNPFSTSFSTHPLYFFASKTSCARAQSGTKTRTSESKHLNRRVSSPHQEPHRDPAPPSASHFKTEPHSPVQGKTSDSKLEEQGTQWQGNLTSTSPWSHPNIAGPSTSAKNLWKPFGSDRTPTLGNGIFDQPLGTFASRENPLGQLGLDSPNMSTSPNFSAPNEPTDSLPSPEARHPSFDPLNPIGRPSPIGPPSARTARINEWNKFHENAFEKEQQNAKEFLKRLDERRKGAPAPPPAPVVFAETWKKTRATEDGRRVVTRVTERVINNDEDIARAKAAANQQANPLTNLDTPMDSLNMSDIGVRPAGNVSTRSSRFFPSASEQSKRQVAEKERSSPSPPPPEEISHPAYHGDVKHPNVNLPAPKPPKPVVKLPPKAMGAPAPPPTFASMAAAPPRNTVPPSSTAMSWQDKINGLFGKTTPTQKKSVLAVTSATKEPLPVHTSAVSVSIPQTKAGSQAGDGDFAVRQVNEQDEMFEDREPGSLPAVRVPNMAPQNSWSATRPSERPRGKNFKQVQSQSIQPFLVGHNDRDGQGNIRASILLPGGSEPKTVLIQRKGGPPRGRNAITNARPRKGINSKSNEVSGGNKKSASNTVPRQPNRQHTGWTPPPTPR